MDASSEQEWNSVDRRWITASRIANYVGSFVLSAILLGIVVIVWLANDTSHWPAIIVFVCFLPLILGGFIYGHIEPSLEYHRLSYRVGELGLEIRRGIIRKHRIAIPLSRIQHADVSQGPLERKYEISKLIIYTAGTQHASIDLPGLQFETAQQLRAMLITGRESADGV